MLAGAGLGYVYGYSTNHKELGIEIDIICGMVAPPFVLFGFGVIINSTFLMPILALVIGSILGKIVGNRLGMFLIRCDVQ